MDFHVRDDATGKVLKNGDCAPGDLILQGEPGQTAYEGRVEETQYWFGSAYVDRPEFSISVTSLTPSVGEGITFTGIPVDTTVFYDEEEILLDDPGDLDLDWSSLTEGAYYFRFENFPYMEKTILIEVG